MNVVMIDVMNREREEIVLVSFMLVDGWVVGFVRSSRGRLVRGLVAVLVSCAALPSLTSS
jgi:hypothetical protein